MHAIWGWIEYSITSPINEGNTSALHRGEYKAETNSWSYQLFRGGQKDKFVSFEKESTYAVFFQNCIAIDTMFCKL